MRKVEKVKERLMNIIPSHVYTNSLLTAWRFVESCPGIPMIKSQPDTKPHTPNPHRSVVQSYPQACRPHSSSIHTSSHPKHT